jgi:hypothetical protein
MKIKLLVSFGSIATAGFGVWHFFVPALWKWYDYIPPQAAELTLAISAINTLFSLCLLLVGIANLVFVYFYPKRFVLIVMLSFSLVLWAVRCVLQIIWPQGSSIPLLQYGMLAAFLLIFACYLIPLLLVVFQKKQA